MNEDNSLQKDELKEGGIPVNGITVRTLSGWQIAGLKDMFSKYPIEKIARVDETADLIIEYIGSDGSLKTISIPTRPRCVQDFKEDQDFTEFEIIQPKQIENGEKSEK